MKRGVLIAILVCAVVLCVGVGVYLWTDARPVQSFSLADYSDELSNFPSDRVTPPVSSPKEARERAEEIWTEIYGDRVQQQKPYRVFYDRDTGVWLVKGHFHLLPGLKGGVAYLLITDGGDVLAVWHTK